MIQSQIQPGLNKGHTNNMPISLNHFACYHYVFFAFHISSHTSSFLNLLTPNLKLNQNNIKWHRKDLNV